MPPKKKKECRQGKNQLNQIPTEQKFLKSDISLCVLYVPSMLSKRNSYIIKRKFLHLPSTNSQKTLIHVLHQTQKLLIYRSQWSRGCMIKLGVWRKEISAVIRSYLAFLFKQTSCDMKTGKRRVLFHFTFSFLAKLQNTGPLSFNHPPNEPARLLFDHQ